MKILLIDAPFFTKSKQEWNYLRFLKKQIESQIQTPFQMQVVTIMYSIPNSKGHYMLDIE